MRAETYARAVEIQDRLEDIRRDKESIERPEWTHAMCAVARVRGQKLSAAVASFRNSILDHLATEEAGLRREFDEL